MRIIAAHEYSFDLYVLLNRSLLSLLTLFYSAGNELMPSTKYDFKFKDYAPSAFRELTEDRFQLDPADYLLSLTAK